MNVCKQCSSVIQNKRNKEYCNKVCRNRALAQQRDQQGENNPHWKGGRKLDSSGYVLVKHPSATRPDGYIQEHVLIMEQHFNRRMEPWEEVHHKDENKQNNTLENLEVISKVEHLRRHAKEWVKNRERDEKGRLK